MSPSPSICVIGAQGTLGNAVLRQFTSAGWTTYPAGRRADSREGFRHIDLDKPETVGPVLRDVDLILSTVAHPNLTAERWVLEHGGLLVNCSHAPASATTTLTRQAQEKKGTVLLNAGLVPGIANLVAAELLDKHHNTPDSSTAPRTSSPPFQPYLAPPIARDASKTPDGTTPCSRSSPRTTSAC